MAGVVDLLCFLLVAGLAQAVSDPVLFKSEGLRYDYLRDENGTPHLVDSWAKLSDLVSMDYDPDRDNQYHLFTRRNPTFSQILINGNTDILNASNFDSKLKNVFVLHGWRGSITAESNTVLIPALLAADDVNVIGIDWRIGAAEPSFYNALASGRSVAGFINWLNTVYGWSGENTIIIGFSLGGQQAGMIGRYVNGNVSYISALDPPKRGHDFEFKADDGEYTEVIHTNVYTMGTEPVGQVNFYPNGGDFNPGCPSPGCNHSRLDRLKLDTYLQILQHGSPELMMC